MGRRSTIPLGVALVLVTVLPRTASGAPADFKPGIDVSHWQGTIDWAKVAGGGITFAFAKATEGQTFNDPMYTTNRSGAAANGILFGAYHFAQPDNLPNDAIIEADHFSSVAAPAYGDIVPVVDLEVSNGLTVDQLTTWLHDFLVEVKLDTGVKAMIYTSPSFWQTSMGDTDVFARNGYRLLWIAHWGVPDPSVPANNWGGNSWAFWQQTNCDTVPGISGCVDGDVYHYTSFLRVRIH